MSYIRKYPAIKRIPPLLMPTSEVLELLHLSHCSSLRAKRYQHLTRIPVVYHGKRILLFVRAEIQKMLYSPPPPGHCTIKRACELFGIATGTRVKNLLHRYRVPCTRVDSWHAYDVWPLDDVRAAASHHHETKTTNTKKS